MDIYSYSTVGKGFRLLVNKLRPQLCPRIWSVYCHKSLQLCNSNNMHITPEYNYTCMLYAVDQK